ncbi:alpha/beta fold hydrolase [Actinomadura sp. LOL_016]|uniref:alpha/beta fold hydrolase n=1 Tax=unclassified Actinomadura TaxID=2626254 RepID=UPI003A802071
MDIPDYRTDPYFGLEDRWRETAPGELTHYHDLGDGVPVTLLHGSGAGVSAAANWWLNLPDLSRGNRAIALDLLGFGRTVVAPGTAFGIDAWVEHTVRLLDALGIERTWLVGNSLGGWVAFQMALSHPDRLLGIVSMGTGGAPRTSVLAGHARPQVSVEGIRKVLREFVTDASLVTGELVQARYNAASAPGAQERFQQVVQARDHDRVHHPLDLDALKGFDRPVLLVHGREDTVIPVSRSLELAEVLPRADLHLFSHCGHWSQVERAAEFNRIVAEFLRTHAETS